MVGRAGWVVVLVAAMAILGCAGPAAAPTTSPTIPPASLRPAASLSPSVALTAAPSEAVAGSPSAIPSLPADLALEGREWLLVRVGGAGPAVDVPPAVRATLTLIDGIASGDSGCNTFQAPYVTLATDVTFGILITTAMPCEGPASPVEAAYLAALRDVRRSGAWDQGMGLYAEEGDPLLGFVPAAPGRLEGSWTVSVYQDLRGALMPAVTDAVPTLVFGADGTLAGSDGCNEYGGSYQVDGPRIGIDGLTGTRTACPTDALAAQEEGFLAALLASTRWSATRTEVTLRGDDGQMTLSLARAPN